jgi:hypothetical protein
VPGQVGADIVESGRNGCQIALRGVDYGLKRKRSEGFEVTLKARIIEYPQKGIAVECVARSCDLLIEIISQ